MTSFQRSFQDEFLLCRICNYVLQQPRTLPCDHSFCLKCLEFCVNASEIPTGFHCPVCRRFYDISKTEGREDWLNKLGKNLILEQILSSVQILEQEIVHQESVDDSESLPTASHVTHLIQIWRSVTHLANFLIQDEQKKLDRLNKQRKTAQIAIRKTCIDVWNLMKREASANDWNNITSREQTLIAEVDAVCSAQSRLIDERISQEKELVKTADENIEHMSSKTEDEIVCDSHQLINDYSQLQGNGASLLLYTTGPCVKLVFIPDTLPINRIALGHLLVIDENILDHCDEVSVIQQSTRVKQINEEHKVKEKEPCSSNDAEISDHPQSIKVVEVTDDQDNTMKEKQSSNSSNTEISDLPQSTTVVEFVDQDKVKNNQSYSSSDTEISGVKTIHGTNTPDEGYKTDASEHSNDTNISTRLPVSSLKLMSEQFSMSPITSYSSSTELWWNLDESSATKVHIDLENPNPGDLELFNVSNTCVVVLVDPHNKSIKSFPDSDICHRIELKHSPVRIAKINDSRCAVTCKSTTLICLLDVTPALELTRCIQTRKSYHSISYVSVSSQFVCCEAKNPDTLDILNMNGQLIRTINLPTIDDVRCEPYNVMVMLSDNILICDVISRALVCISQSGDVIFTYKPEGILLPVGVCSDRQGNIFLADAKEHRVILLSDQGNMIGHVISEKDGLKEPWGIRYDENRRRFCVIMKRSEFKWFDQTELDFEQFQREK